jgi:hypothetical protein
VEPGGSIGARGIARAGHGPAAPRAGEGKSDDVKGDDRFHSVDGAG